MKFDHLKVFCTAARKQNFSETAKALHLSQPSVSSYIRQLETDFGAVLFERTTKNVQLTEAGTILYHYASDILEDLQAAKRDLDQLKNAVNGELIVGASLTIGEYILPYLLGGFKKKHPHVHLKMKSYNSAQITDELDSEALDLGFIESMTSYSRFKQQAFQEDELVIIASNQMTGLEDKVTTLSFEDLFQLPIILRERGSGTRQVIEEHLKRHQLNPDLLNVILELENTESIKSAVESDIGISIISKAAVLKELRLGTLRQLSLDQIRFTRHFYAVYRNDRLSSQGQAFLNYVFETLGNNK